MKFMDTSCEDKICTILRRIQRVYLVLLILTGLSTLPLLTSIIAEPPIPENEIKDVIQFCLYLSVYWGLIKIKKWVVPLILLTSTFSSLLLFLQFLTPATDAKQLLAKGISAFMCLFFVYQTIFFSKKEVRVFFGMNKQIIFSS